MACDCKEPAHAGSCRAIPPIERLRYFFGQPLSDADFRLEQTSIRTKLRLLARQLGGYGIVCGLEVSVVHVDAGDCLEHDCFDQIEIVIQPGIAVDCNGDLLIVREERRARLRKLFAKHGETRDALERPFWITICYCEAPSHPTRPLLVDPCSPLECEQYGRIIECADVDVVFTDPTTDSCDDCCEGCDSPCLTLVRIEACGESVDEWLGDFTVRRPFGRHHLTTITQISWVHGLPYPSAIARVALEDGLGIRFSRPVHANTMCRPGVVEVRVYEGGSGRREEIYFKAVDVVPVDEDSRGLAREFRIAPRSHESLQDHDRVLVIVRTDFVLDECCRAVDGNHIGGKVPQYDPSWAHFQEVELSPDLPCPVPPDHPRPWTSGNGSEGGTFESWFHIFDPLDDSADAAGAD